MGGADEQLVVVFEEERPLGRVESGLGRLGLDGKVAADLRGCDLTARELAAGGHRGGGRGVLESLRPDQGPRRTRPSTSSNFSVLTLSICVRVRAKRKRLWESVRKGKRFSDSADPWEHDAINCIVAVRRISIVDCGRKRSQHLKTRRPRPCSSPPTVKMVS